MTIPASALVSVTPGVLSAGGAAVDLNGLFLTTNTRVPIGQVLQFATSDAVGEFFGDDSAEYSAAAVYFGGFDNSNVKPGVALFAQYAQAPVAAWLRGGSLAGMTLTALQALSGTLTITVDGTTKTSAAISLSTATSFSNAATLILAGFTSPGFTVTYDSVSNAFVFTSSTTGEDSTTTYCTGTLASGLKLTQAASATLSQGADAATPAAAMNGIKAVTLNWAGFTTLFNPDTAGETTERLAFAAWTSGQNNRFIYAAWDSDTAPTLSSSAPTSLGALIAVANYSGTILTWSPDATKSAFVLGWAASLDFTETNGRADLCYRGQSGLIADVTDETVYNNLLANGYNGYASFSTATKDFVNFQDGAISGPWIWADAFVNQIWFNASLQAALLTLLTSAKSIPYNTAGYALLRAACLDPITAALNFGAIRTGVTLSNSQVAQVNTAAGRRISDTLQQTGWYLLIGDADAATRADRGSPPMTLWYMDGGSVQTINLSSITVQ